MKFDKQPLFRSHARRKGACLLLVAGMAGLASCASPRAKEERLMSDAVGFSIAEAGKFFSACAREQLDCDRWAESFFVLMGPGMNALLSSPSSRAGLSDYAVGELCNGLGRFLSAPLPNLSNEKVAQMAVVYRPFAAELYGLMDEEAKRRELTHAGCDAAVSVEEGPQR